jgi:DNA-binding MarR family transcriptional regulator
MINQTDSGFLKGDALYQILVHLSEQNLEIDPKLVRTAYALLDFISSSLVTSEAYFGRYGLSQGRLLILMLLVQDLEQTWTPAKLADTLGVTRATVTGLLNVLEKDNWIERLPYSKDGRMKVVILTETGRAKITEFIPGHLERMTKLWANFSDEELELLLRLLVKAKNALSSLLTQAEVGNEVST